MMTHRDEKQVIRALTQNPNQFMARLKARTGVQRDHQTNKQEIKIQTLKKKLRHPALKIHKQHRPEFARLY